MILVGIDCAVDVRNVGLAFASCSDEKCEIRSAGTGNRTADLEAAVARLLANESEAVLAFDAPLGWPLPLRKMLADHVAGEAIAYSANDMFRRETDRDVRKRHGIQSLDVGADRIARTAHAALLLLNDIRARTGKAIPLAIESGPPTGAMAIEVYPAATLEAHDLPFRSYKKSEDLDTRRKILEGIKEKLTIACDHELLVQNANVLDAAVCVLSALDFVKGVAVAPGNAIIARAEGWIWVR